MDTERMEQAGVAVDVLVFQEHQAMQGTCECGG